MLTEPLQSKILYTFGQNNGGQGQLLKKWLVYPSEWLISGAVKGKSRCWGRDGRRKRGRKRQRVYKGSSRRLSLGDGSQMSDPGPLQLIVKNETYLFFLSLSLTLFSLLICISPFSFLSEMCFALPYFPYYFALWFPVFTLNVREGQLHLGSLQMALRCCLRSQYASSKQRNVSFHVLFFSLTQIL